jgi:hypothetical protein
MGLHTSNLNKDKCVTTARKMRNMNNYIHFGYYGSNMNFKQFGLLEQACLQKLFTGKQTH